MKALLDMDARTGRKIDAADKKASAGGSQNEDADAANKKTSAGGSQHEDAPAANSVGKDGRRSAALEDQTLASLYEVSLFFVYEQDKM